MRELVEALFEQLEENWIKVLTGVILTGLGWAIGYWRARVKWTRKEFLDRLNISLNTIEDGTLRIRTISERDGEEIFLNKAAAKRVVNAARQTTAAKPLLPISQDDYWFFLNSVLNEISEAFAEGLMRRDMGLPVEKTNYLVCLTSEAAGTAKTRKVRAMLIRKDLLLKLPEEAPEFEAPLHSTRWETLKIMAKEYETRPWQFLEMEICLSR
ncbi:hypothetical protein [Calycomorphotria hydatis]|uniref:Uncharacterized protein n=1 Tax=Calycomorphotria hydatis TaxID=2528027 RepID=A0A517TEZ6_9PLAN|nr:hypothetical protein [Calycomorphotria hydatis]QDT66946.1 hypothetical protein V22_42180 [Calycomorphotria hydatis]